MHRRADVALRLGERLALLHVVTHRHQRLRRGTDVLLHGHDQLRRQRRGDARRGVRQSLLVRQVNTAVEVPETLALGIQDGEQHRFGVGLRCLERAESAGAASAREA